MTLTVKPSNDLSCTPGSFGAVLNKTKGELYLPPGVVRAVKTTTQKDVSLAVDFLDAAFNRCSEVARNLDWAPSDLYTATRELTLRLVMADLIPISTLNHPMMCVPGR